MSHDAVLVLSFGGPEGPDDVLPFLRNVTRGRGVPDERLAEVAEQYDLFGGRSPINDQCRELVALLGSEFAANGIDLPVYWGNRNWHPMVEDTVATMTADGVRNALVFVTSAFGTYSGCRQYREDLARAAAAVGDDAPALTKLRLFYNHPGFIEPLGANLANALAADGVDPLAGSTHVVFTAHSIPNSMAAGCDYESQLAEAARLVLTAAGVADAPHDVVFQSRSGPPQVPWLEPDVNDHLHHLAQAGTPHVTVVPVGFVSDHMEVMFDLDTQAAATAADLGLGYRRVSTTGNHPQFVSMIRELVLERMDGATPVALGAQGVWPTPCPPDHCPAPQRPGRPPTATGASQQRPR
ncbi:MAG: ferrochelatase [Actinomycetota bacterium]